MDQTLAKGRSPATADAAVFLSNAGFDESLKQVVGAIIKLPAAKTGDLTVNVDDVRAVPGAGMTGVAVDANIASPQRHLAAKMTVEGITKRGDDFKGFIVLPKRWIVERTFGRINRPRRLAKDFDASVSSSQAWFMLAVGYLLVRRIARDYQTAA